MYEGIDQFYQVFEEFIQEAQGEILCYCNPNYFHEIITLEYLKLWIKKREDKNLDIRILATKTGKYAEVLNTDEKNKRSIKWLPDNISPFKGTFYMYETRIVTWNPVLPKAVSIEDKIIVDTYKSMFNFIWNSL